ncbi:hypothetical protein UFOVP1620_6 [uncultured Caudovirales phage]|uniref:Uncharacterized protein n=1 Tax=uncultured Caudovirales phage TaxID=2100421 RepID=A0A6J5SWW2_9CAUD|nr:hypothetical protein UFOVP1620_6 [uncultured Caudovirales phage]
MSNLCQKCGKSIARGGYPIGGGRTACRYCAVRATGLTTTALRAAHGARIAGENYRRVIKRLKDKIAKYEQLEASMQERIDYLEDEIASMIDDKETYEREMAKHGNK